MVFERDKSERILTILVLLKLTVVIEPRVSRESCAVLSMRRGGEARRGGYSASAVSIVS